MVVVEQYLYMEYGLPQHSTAVRLPRDGGELSLSVCVLIVCYYCSGVVSTSYILVLPAIHGGCIQLWSGNGKCIFRNKIEKFCCNFNFY